MQEKSLKNIITLIGLRDEKKKRWNLINKREIFFSLKEHKKLNFNCKLNNAKLRRYQYWKQGNWSFYE